MRSPCIALGSLALALAVPTLAAQAPAGGISPPARAHHTLFYDDAQQRVMLTGGTSLKGPRDYELRNDLWSFDGARWQALPASGEKMSGARVDVDLRQRAFSFGGWNEEPMGVLRLLENNRWRTIGVHPVLTTAEGGFVFDAARNRFVAFGGGGAPQQALSQVWEFDGARWLRHPATPPPVRGSHVMVYDAGRKKTVIFGGMGARVGDQEAPMLGDTWEFDGSGWTRMTGPGPSPRIGAGATYDSRRGLVLVFGGANREGDLNDLWAWNGVVWQKLAEGGPTARVMGWIAYDKRRDRVVLFGGRHGYADLGDTWEWDGRHWKQVGS